MVDPDFIYTSDQLKQIAEDTLRYARQKGVSGAAVGVSEGNGLSVSVRKGDIETIEKNRDKGIGVTGGKNEAKNDQFWRAGKAFASTCG